MNSLPIEGKILPYRAVRHLVFPDPLTPDPVRYAFPRDRISMPGSIRRRPRLEGNITSRCESSPSGRIDERATEEYRRLGHFPRIRENIVTQIVIRCSMGPFRAQGPFRPPGGTILVLGTAPVGRLQQFLLALEND